MNGIKEMGVQSIPDNSSPLHPSDETQQSSRSTASFDGLTLDLNAALQKRTSSIRSDASSEHYLGDIEADLQVRDNGSKLKTSSSTMLQRAASETSVTTSVNTMMGFRKSLADAFIRRPEKDNTTATATATNVNTAIRGGRSQGRQESFYNFLVKEEEKDVGSLQGVTKWWHRVFLFSFISLLACIITLWAPYPIGARQPSDVVAQSPWSDGCQGGLTSCICPRETICADDMMSMIFLTMARCSAWFDYPLYMLLFLSKARNVNNFLQTTMLKCWINFADFHKVHALFGCIVGIESMSHAFFHILRWARRKDDIQLLWSHQTGRTGLISLILCPLIVLPMTLPFLKAKISFEWRKGLHYLSIVWAACLMFHAPQRIYWLFGVPLVIYIVDRVFGVLYKTHLLENTFFERLGDSSCIVTFENPPGFGKQNSAYVYIMLPWLSKYQFHAFSVFPCNKPNHSQLCISKAGKWTSDLMTDITTPTHKPAFIVGPFLSPFCSPAMNSENIIAVASGIGVTPTISLIKQYMDTSRRLNLIWICRDAGLVEWFLENISLSDNGYTLIYYTGKRSLAIEEDLPGNVLIYEGRPNLERTINGLIVSIASGEGLPEGLNEGMKSVTNSNSPEIRAKLLLEKALSIYSMDQLFDYAIGVSNESREELELEPLVDAVDYRGASALMEKLLKGCYNSIKDKLITAFGISSSNDLLKRDDFEAFMNSMLITEEGDNESVAMARCRSMFVGTYDSVGKLGSSYHFQPASTGSREAKSYLLGDGKFATRNWSMLYCGGSAVVLQSLREYKSKHGITLSVEKFDW